MIQPQAVPVSDDDGDSDDYPLPAFYFKLIVNGFNSDISFQDVSGISREMETEEYFEGGENEFVHHLPAKMKYQKLVMKRGITRKQSQLVDWCSKVLEGGLAEKIDPKNVDVLLMNAEGKAIRSWSFSNAYPVKWEVGGFNSEKNDISIETIELSYNSFKMKIESPPKVKNAKKVIKG